MKKMIALSLTLLAAGAVAAHAADAKELWDKNCKKCHGEDGKGETKMGKKLGAKDYTDPKVQDALKDDAAIKSIKEGLKKQDGTNLMQPAEGLTDDQIKGLVAYMRTFKK